MFVVICMSFVVCCCLIVCPVVRCLLLFVGCRCFLPVACYVMLAVCCLLYVVRCLLFVLSGWCASVGVIVYFLCVVCLFDVCGSLVVARRCEWLFCCHR